MVTISMMLSVVGVCSFSEGQGMRDTKRIVALEKEFDCRVFTVDKTHPERVSRTPSLSSMLAP